MHLPPLTLSPDPGSQPLPAGAQLIFTQARRMETQGAVAAATTLYWEITGPMDEAAMCKAMDTLAHTRDFLHLALENRDGIGFVRDVKPLPVEVEPVAARNLAEEMSAWSRRSTAPGTPVCRLRLLRMDEERYALGLSGPHDLLDIWTFHHTLADLAGLYNRLSDHSNPTVPAAGPGPGFRDFSAWYEQCLASGCLTPSRDFWHHLLNSTSPLFTAPPDPDLSAHPLSAVFSTRPMDPDLCRGFEVRTRAVGASVFEGYFTLYNLALSKITGRTDLLTAFVVSLRRTPGIGEVMGCLLNRFYIPVRLSEGEGFAPLVQRVSKTMSQAKTHCLWPVWKDLDPGGTGYPGMFFHYVPPDRGNPPEFNQLTISAMNPVRHRFWPHPVSFQVTGDPDKPMLAAFGQAGFCSQAWLGTLQDTFIDILARI